MRRPRSEGPERVRDRLFEMNTELQEGSRPLPEWPSASDRELMVNRGETQKITQRLHDAVASIARPSFLQYGESFIRRIVWTCIQRKHLDAFDLPRSARLAVERIGLEDGHVLTPPGREMGDHSQQLDASVFTPASSWASRRAVSARDSPRSGRPPGKNHSGRYVCLTRRIVPSSTSKRRTPKETGWRNRQLIRRRRYPVRRTKGTDDGEMEGPDERLSLPTSTRCSCMSSSLSADSASASLWSRLGRMVEPLLE